MAQGAARQLQPGGGARRLSPRSCWSCWLTARNRPGAAAGHRSRPDWEMLLATIFIVGPGYGTRASTAPGAAARWWPGVAGAAAGRSGGCLAKSVWRCPEPQRGGWPTVKRALRTPGAAPVRAAAGCRHRARRRLRYSASTRCTSAQVFADLRTGLGLLSGGGGTMSAPHLADSPRSPRRWPAAAHRPDGCRRRNAPRPPDSPAWRAIYRRLLCCRRAMMSGFPAVETAVFCARLRTSSATTAKPRPARRHAQPGSRRSAPAGWSVRRWRGSRPAPADLGTVRQGFCTSTPVPSMRVARRPISSALCFTAARPSAALVVAASGVAPPAGRARRHHRWPRSFHAWRWTSARFRPAGARTSRSWRVAPGCRQSPSALGVLRPPRPPSPPAGRGEMVEAQDHRSPATLPRRRRSICSSSAVSIHHLQQGSPSRASA